MNLSVIKRDKVIVPFNDEKVRAAVEKANQDVIRQDKIGLTEHEINCVVDEIVDTIAFSDHNTWTVETIQDLVEETLMDFNKNVARAYVRFRYKKEVAREYKADFFETIGEKLEAKNVVNQNANVDEHSFGGRVGEASDAMMKEYALNFCMSKMARENHLNNQIYIHDLSAYAVGMHNCLSVPFDHLLRDGFNTRQADIRPANSVDTAFQLLAVIFQLQSLQQFGGVSATHLDWTMVPYVRKSFWKHYKTGLEYLPHDEFICIAGRFPDVDFGEFNGSQSIEHPLYKYFDNIYNYALNMTTKEVQQAVEGMYHNLNTLQSRSGNQLKCVAG